METDQIIGIVLLIVGIILCGVGAWFAVSLGAGDFLIGAIIFILSLVFGGGAIVYGLMMMHPDLEHLLH